MARLNSFNSSEEIDAIMKDPKRIFNLCIMAHVDHGKTSLADCLLAHSGIIHQRHAGEIRYMDSRKDEMERGITMKSSCVSVVYTNESGRSCLVNLIDSPGHVDFSFEVSTAVRLCDGAIVLVDVVEGVCAQTKVVLRQAWLGKIKTVLVLNKIDRLITEKLMTVTDAYFRIAHVLEQVNAYMGEMYNDEVLKRQGQAKGTDNEAKVNGERLLTLNEDDDSQLYFSPKEGNVIFASAIDGWAFSIRQFAKRFASKIGLSESELNDNLWGDNYLATEKGPDGAKVVAKTGARDKQKKPLFVSVVLENLFHVYDELLVKTGKAPTAEEATAAMKLADKLGISLPLGVAKTKESRVRLKYVCSRWLPLAPVVFDMVMNHLPNAASISFDRARHLICTVTRPFDSLPPQTQALASAFVECLADPPAPLVVYVSKIFGVDRKLLPHEGRNWMGVTAQAAPGLVSDEDIAARLLQIRQMAEAAATDTTTTECPIETPGLIEEEIVSEMEVFIAFARVFSGTLSKGQKVFVLGAKHDPEHALRLLGENGEFGTEGLLENPHVTVCEVGDIYLMVGRDLKPLSCACAGAVVGIRGLWQHVVKSATLASTVACPAFTELTLNAKPILRVALEPVKVKDLARLRKGLQMLDRADPCVQVIHQDNGQNVIVTAGEVHLQRCINDLRERYAQIPFEISKPIVPFRETIVKPPSLDRRNEVISGDNISLGRKTDELDPENFLSLSSAMSRFQCHAVPLPPRVMALLEANEVLLRVMANSETLPIVDADQRQHLDVETKCDIQRLRQELQIAFQQSEFASQWSPDVVDHIWSLGPKGYGPNVLINHIVGYERPSVWSHCVKVDSPLAELDASVVTGFNMATKAGPLCKEPMRGVAFVVDAWELGGEESDSASARSGGMQGAMSAGELIPYTRDAFYKAFKSQPQRLCLAMYSCTISVTASAVGRVYSEIGKRHGFIEEGDAADSSNCWDITARLPVVESYNFAGELMKQTSGESMPQLIFSHWEVLDLDPFWEPQTPEELLYWGDTSDKENRAHRYMNTVRKRKGMEVDEKIITFAEKQRTLSKKK